jgi:hypothetical protein
VPAALRIVKRFDLSVRFTGTMMPAAANDPSAFDENCADHGVGGSEAEAATGQANC